MALGGAWASGQEQFPLRESSRTESVISSPGQSRYIVGLRNLCASVYPQVRHCFLGAAMFQRAACAEAAGWGLRLDFLEVKFYF